MIVSEKKQTLVETITEEMEALIDITLPELIQELSPVELSKSAAEIVDILVRAKLSQRLKEELITRCA